MTTEGSSAINEDEAGDVRSAFVIRRDCICTQARRVFAAMIVSVEQGQIHACMRLIPGVEVSSTVIATVDSDADGVFSDAEQQTYAREVLGDLSLSVDGHALKPRLRAVSFPAPADIKGGLGEIHIEFDADCPLEGRTHARDGEPPRAADLRQPDELFGPARPEHPRDCTEPQSKSIVLPARLRTGRLSTGFVAVAMAIASCYALSTFRGLTQHVPTRRAAHRGRYGSSVVPDSTPVTCTATCRPVLLGRTQQYPPQSCADCTSDSSVHHRPFGHAGIWARGDSCLCLTAGSKY